MEAYPDFKELFGLFNAKKVEYIIVGAHALAYHGAPRFTGDIDILVHANTLNSRRIIQALSDFGFSFPDLNEDDFTKPDNVVQLGVPPARVDILTSISGISWEEAYAGKAAGTYGDIPVFFLGKKEYVANKKASGRKKDLADLEALGEA